ncbi:MAG: glycosyltransferase family 4 protein [Actinomycetota bacterium]|nr:glycosyltransferase family 4 protein [Actinomycetota bacterium]
MAWTAPRRDGDAPTVLRLASVFEPDRAVFAREDAASYDPVGGMQNHVAELSRCLDDLGVRQQVLTSRLAGPVGRVRLGRHSEVRRTGLRIRRFRQLWALLAAPRALSAKDVRLVHAHQGEDIAVLLLGLLAAARHRCPLVLTMHLSIRHTLPVTSARTAVLKVLGGFVERLAVGRAAGVFVLTPRTRDQLVADGTPADRVHVVPSGFDPALFAGRYDDPLPYLRRPRVVSVGRLAPQKRPLDLVSAFERMRTAAHLVVVGDGPLRVAMERRVADSPARDRITLVGLVPHDEVPGYLAHADVFVLPSDYEELGSVLVEAMASSLPVVANAVDGIPALVAHGRRGLLVRRGDVTALAAVLDDVLTGPELARRLVRAAREHVMEHYSWPALAGRIHDVYAGVAPGAVPDVATQSFAAS